MAGKIRTRIIFLLLFCIATSFCVPALAAQDPEFRLDMDSLNLEKGVSSSFVVSLINAKDAQIVSIDGLENFDILSQSQSSYTSIVNNVATYQVDMHYVIMPKTTGQFTLKANIQYNSQYYETNSLEVTVTQGSNHNNGAVPDTFVKTISSHTEAYLGEKVIVTYEVYTRESIESLGFTDYTSIDGVITKEIPTDQLKTETVYIDGNRYTMYEVKQLIIDPIKTGVCTIPSFNLQINVITDSGIGGGFGGLFRSTTPKYLQTEEAEILVKSLPLEGKPNNFSGIIGELNISGHYSRNEVNYGDSLALQIEASGNCNLDGLKNIVSGGISGFTVYETQKDFEESVENNRYYARKSFETILIPEKNGELDVSPVAISYFNPATGRYETAEIPEATIKVLGDMSIPNINEGNQVASLETVIVNQVSYADADLFGDYLTIKLPKQQLYMILIGIAVFLVLVAVLLWFILSRRKRDTTLKSLYRQLMGAKDINEIYNLFNAMIKYCYKVNIKASSRNTILSSLPDADLASQVTDIMDYMESAKAYDEKGYIYLKDKIRGIYTVKLRVYQKVIDTVK